MARAVSEERLSEIVALVVAATEGPWEAITDCHGPRNLTHSVWAGEVSPRRYVAESAITDVDAEFIAASREIVPELVAEVRRLHRIESSAVAALVVTGSMPMVEMTAEGLAGWRHAMRLIRAALADVPEWPTEYAVRCQDGSIDPEADHDADDLAAALDAATCLDDKRAKFCGAHTVQQRAVGPWQRVITVTRDELDSQGIPDRSGT